MSEIGRRFAAAQAATQSVNPFISLAGREFKYSCVGEDQIHTHLPDDIIVGEILPRLSIKALFKSKLISKQYESIISDPGFAKLYLQRAHSSRKSWSSSDVVASMLFPFTHEYRHRLSKNVRDLTDIAVAHNHDNDELPISVCRVSLQTRDDQKIRASSNGLTLSIVCRILSRDNNGIRFFLYVSNPLTEHCKRIPNSTLNNYFDLVYGIATRPDQATALLTYKVVLIQYKIHGFFLKDNAKGTIDIFSSDTGSWKSWKVKGFPVDFSDSGTVEAMFAHRGVLHWLGFTTRTVITYDPYDNPDRFVHIQLPKSKYSSSDFGSLIYSGDEERVKYCEMGKGVTDGTDRVMVWRLLDSEWCVEGEFSFPSLPRLCTRLLVALDPCNPDVVCHPYVIDGSMMVINLHTGSWKFVNVLNEHIGEGYDCFLSGSRFYPLIPVELCPWSSPYYALPRF